MNLDKEGTQFFQIIKLLIALIVIIVMAGIFSLADIDIGRPGHPDIFESRDLSITDESRYQEWPLVKAVDGPVPEAPDGCLAVKLPEEVLTGTDTACHLAALVMRDALGNYEVNCLYIVNHGYFPSNKRTLNRNEIEYLVALAGAPETRSLEELPCEDCPFDQLERCPQCVEIFEEAYQQMGGSDGTRTYRRHTDN
jgi:hypothetical protein